MIFFFRYPSETLVSICGVLNSGYNICTCFFSVCRVAISCLKTITAQFSAYRQELSRQGAGASNIDCISARHHESHPAYHTYAAGLIGRKDFFLSSVSRQDRTRDKAHLAHIELDFHEVMICFFVQGLASSEHISFS